MGSMNRDTQALIDAGWRVIAERVPLPEESWIEECRYGSGVLMNVPHNGAPASPLPEFSRMIVEWKPMPRRSARETFER
jgi:hypothetical protein